MAGIKIPPFFLISVISVLQIFQAQKISGMGNWSQADILHKGYVCLAIFFDVLSGCELKGGG